MMQEAKMTGGSKEGRPRRSEVVGRLVSAAPAGPNISQRVFTPAARGRAFPSCLSTQSAPHRPGFRFVPFYFRCLRPL